MGKDSFVVAVVGATGAVGREMLKTLEARKFPVSKIVPLASSRSAGSEVEFNGEKVIVQELTEDSFEGIDLALFSAGGAVSEEYAPLAARSGCVVVDNSSTWRMDDQCPLVVPEVNPDDLDWHKGIIANPNCSTIQMVVPLKPIHDAAKITRIVVSTYQAVAGGGQKAMDEMTTQVRQMFNFDLESIEPKVMPYRIAFNCLPQIDVFLENDYTKEEMKMVHETHKIFGDDSFGVSPTAVRVPVYIGHSESVNIETEKKMTAAECRALLSQAPGVRVLDNPAEKIYPMPIEAVDEDDTFVGRIREDNTVENGLNMWICADNLRKGAALNAVQIAEELVKRDLVRVP
ncbi:aspartate-semialdehyde dehydrogenase [Desulfobaculum bizertense]|uniref:Aspartate-semialdehyde dehydrogenase n=1 Tax=Desulfobaculum bizertense DSM 18034 TaxID=1121442 RepID=A0A1T4VP49_9BACT|nr:aspartate-semialdehyde dehydrogenase [Desulfobaculum bizertense]UIJ38166.1 aspartate-semialdehyde dehydrogenase [Desulfobaculum bizertense]SKA66675.1 aspartate-semialdehyde dehydrogenase [Desulfobaculum bizertense DSM 18034]